ncbi:hypothetical protein ACHAW6_000663 [Cyclotella cf. meneghiniana]
MNRFHANMFKRLKPSRETSSGSDLATKEVIYKNAEYPPRKFQPGLSSTVPYFSLDGDAVYQAGGNNLLEDWPEDVPSPSRNTCKKVTISEHSQLRLFNARIAASQGWYSSKDREVFQAEAVCEAFRIRELMAVASEGGNKRGKATLYLIQRNLLSPEEMLGIEDLINSVSSARRASNVRRLHTALVLRKQEELQKMGESNISNKLAELASYGSSKHAERARLRAALAAPSKYDRSYP